VSGASAAVAPQDIPEDIQGARKSTSRRGSGTEIATACEMPASAKSRRRFDADVGAELQPGKFRQ
jgi:hypothetical protein